MTKQAGEHEEVDETVVEDEIREEGAEIEAEVEAEEVVEKDTDTDEARAQRMGWVPEERFRGDKAKWVDAKTFLERGERELPILRERLRNQDKTIVDLQATVKDVGEYVKKSDERAYNRLRKEVEEKQTKAREVGDFDAYEAAGKELQALDKEYKQPEKKADEKDGKPATDPMSDPVYAGWVQENKWFNSDKELAAYAEAHGLFLNRTKPTLVGREFLDAVAKAVKKEFPEKFENPRRQSTPKVQGNGSGGGPSKSGKTYADLPKDAKEQCDRYLKQGIVKSKEQYALDYFAQ